MTQQTVADQIRETKEMIDKPQKWCRGDMERNGRHCAFGAAVAVNGRGIFGDGPEWWDTIMLQATREVVGYSSLIDYNDEPTSTHADLMRIFDRAIELAEAKAA